MQGKEITLIFLNMLTLSPCEPYVARLTLLKSESEAGRQEEVWSCKRWLDNRTKHDTKLNVYMQVLTLSTAGQVFSSLKLSSFLMRKWPYFCWQKHFAWVHWIYSHRTRSILNFTKYRLSIPIIYYKMQETKIKFSYTKLLEIRNWELRSIAYHNTNLFKLIISVPYCFFKALIIKFKHKNIKIWKPFKKYVSLCFCCSYVKLLPLLPVKYSWEYVYACIQLQVHYYLPMKHYSGIFISQKMVPSRLLGTYCLYSKTVWQIRLVLIWPQNKKVTTIINTKVTLEQKFQNAQLLSLYLNENVYLHEVKIKESTQYFSS